MLDTAMDVAGSAEIAEVIATGAEGADLMSEAVSVGQMAEYAMNIAQGANRVSTVFGLLAAGEDCSKALLSPNCGMGLLTGGLSIFTGPLLGLPLDIIGLPNYNNLHLRCLR
jgi:hypothetical protein